MITHSEVIVLGVVLPVLDIMFVALRLWVKRRRASRLDISDYLITFTMLCVCSLGAVCIYGSIRQGLGGTSPPVALTQGINTEEDDVLVKTKQLADVFNIMSPWLFGTAKLSVLFFYRSIFAGRAFHLISLSMIIVVCIWMVVSFLFLVLQCGARVPYLWTSAKNIAQYCMSGFYIAISVSTTDVATDLLILIMPIYWLLKLHMPLWKRFCVCGVFLFGAVTIASSILRLAEYSIVYPGHNTDPNQYAYLTAIVYYGTIEAGLCVIAACLPVLGPLLTRSGRNQLRHGSRYKVSGSETLSGSIESYGKSQRSASSKVDSISAPLSQLQFLPRDQAEFVHMETRATGGELVNENIENEPQAILVSTGISHESYGIPKAL